MGRSRRRDRRLGRGLGDDLGAWRDEMAAPLLPRVFPSPYALVRSERPPSPAPVLELAGLEPWAQIPGPALLLEDATENDAEERLESHDPAQLELAPGARGAGRRPEPAKDEAVAEPPLVREPVPAADEKRPEPAAAASAPPPAAPPPDPIETLCAEARAVADAGRPEEAKQLYRQLLATQPAHVRARNNLALLLDAEGNHQAALVELDRALDVDGENCTLLVNRGALLGALGRYAAAERDLKKVLRLEPSNAEALFNLGVVMTKKGLWGEAVPHLQRAVELQPDRAAAHYYLGEALNHVDDLRGALAAYQRAAELQPTNARALYGLGIIYDRLARPEDAAVMYRRSREVGRR
jgi:Flp pilus assembly protein TadD